MKRKQIFIGFVLAVLAGILGFASWIQITVNKHGKITAAAMDSVQQQEAANEPDDRTANERDAVATDEEKLKKVLLEERTKINADIAASSVVAAAYKTRVMDICERQFQSRNVHGINIPSNQMGAINCYNGAILGQKSSNWGAIKTHSPAHGASKVSKYYLVKHDSVYIFRLYLDCFETIPKVGWYFRKLGIGQTEIPYLGLSPGTLVNVKHGFDEDEHEMVQATINSAGIAIVDKDNALAFIQKLEGKSTLRVVIPGTHNEDADVVFDLSGHEGFYPTMKKACGM